MRWAALLRGVNVAGHRRLAMADLRALLEAQGYGAVRTLLASGNAVFEADARDGARLEAELERAAKARLGLDTDFLLRDGGELAETIRANPFPQEAETRPGQLVVHFARETLRPDLPDRLAGLYHGPERIVARGRQLYVDYPEGMGRSKLPQALAKLKLPKPTTGRNWNTVLKLAAMLED